MRKITSIFMLTALLMVTLFVFASSKKMAESLDLYADLGGSSYKQITNGSQSFVELTTDDTDSPTQAQISDREGNFYPLVHGVSKEEVYSVSTW